MSDNKQSILRSIAYSLSRGDYKTGLALTVSAIERGVFTAQDLMEQKDCKEVYLRFMREIDDVFDNVSRGKPAPRRLNETMYHRVDILN